MLRFELKCLKTVQNFLNCLQKTYNLATITFEKNHAKKINVERMIFFQIRNIE